MTAEEIAKIKSTLEEMLRFHIQAQRLRLEVLKSMQMQLENANDENTIKRIHNDLIIMLGIQ